MTQHFIIYTIHDHPADYPKHFVVTRDAIVRGFDVPMRMAVIWLCETLEEARDIILDANPHATVLARDPSDPPKILESWI